MHTGRIEIEEWKETIAGFTINVWSVGLYGSETCTCKLPKRSGSFWNVVLEEDGKVSRIEKLKSIGIDEADRN